jgi:hypothetical protein
VIDGWSAPDPVIRLVDLHASSGRTASTRRIRKQPFAQLGDELLLTDRFGMYSEPTRLLKVNGGSRAPGSLSVEISKSAGSLNLTCAALHGRTG